MAPPADEPSANRLTKPITSKTLSVDTMSAALAKQLSKVERAAAEKVVAKEIFRLLGIDRKTHTECFTAALGKIRSTKVLEAESFSKWGGHRNLEIIIKDFPELRKIFPDRINMLSAPDMIAISAVKQIRRVRSSGKDKLTVELDEFKLWDWLPVAIEVFSLTQKCFQIVQIGCSEEQKDERAANGHGYIFYRPAPPPGILSSTSMAILDRPLEIPSTPRSTFQQEHTVNRGDVLTAGSTILEKIGKRESNQNELKDEVAAWLDEYKVRVLPGDIKDRVELWGRRFTPPHPVVSWIAKASADLTEYSYITTELLPHEPFRTWEMMIHPLHDFVELAKTLEPAVRKRFEAMARNLVDLSDLHTKQHEWSQGKMKETTDVLSKALHDVRASADLQAKQYERSEGKMKEATDALSKALHEVREARDDVRASADLQAKQHERSEGKMKEIIDALSKALHDFKPCVEREDNSAGIDDMRQTIHAMNASFNDLKDIITKSMESPAKKRKLAPPFSEYRSSDPLQEALMRDVGDDQ